MNRRRMGKRFCGSTKFMLMPKDWGGNMTEFSQQQFALFVLFSRAHITTRSENAKQILAHFRCVYFSHVCCCWRRAFAPEDCKLCDNGSLRRDTTASWGGILCSVVLCKPVVGAVIHWRLFELSTMTDIRSLLVCNRLLARVMTMVERR